MFNSNSYKKKNLRKKRKATSTMSKEDLEKLKQIGSLHMTKSKRKRYRY